MKSYKSIKEVKQACDSGEIDESKLDIRFDYDNDTVSFCKGDLDEDGDPIVFFSGDGYCDIEDLYPLLFPKAKVEWC